MKTKAYYVRQIVGSMLSGVCLQAMISPAAAAQAQAQAEAQVQAPAPAELDQQQEEVATAAAERQEDPDEIVITGSLIRGAAPTGANVLAVDEDDLRVNGVENTSQLMTTLPQFTNFNRLQFAVPSGSVVTTNKANLRGLPGFQTSGGGTTLVLLNGHRMVGVGVNSTVPDMDSIPVSAVQRLEIVPGGGSAIYGSDAVAGVMNFISRKSFDGVEVAARYGFANAYHQINTEVSAGTNWGRGSVFVTYNFSKNDQYFGRHRDYVRQQPADIAGIPFPVTSLQCSPGNVQNLVAGGVHALGPNGELGALNTANQCDPTDFAPQHPAIKRHSVLMAGEHELTDTLKFTFDAYYLKRTQHSNSGPFRSSSIIGTGGITSPFQAQYAAAGARQQVYYQWDDEDAGFNHINLQTWGIAPGLTLELGGDWQARVVGYYGWSHTRVDASLANATALSNAIRAGLFNPYNPAASDPAALAAIRDNDNFGWSKERMYNARAIVDGTLFNLPGGPVKTAVGVEYTHEIFRVQKGVVPFGTEDTGFPGLSLPANLPGNPLTVIVPPVAARPIVEPDRTVKAIFGELNVPLFGPDNALPGLYRLTLSASGRYDHYSDVGGTFNPRLGMTYQPVSWITIRGTWGKSFNAPSLADGSLVNPLTAAVATSAVSGTATAPPVALQQPNGPYPVPLPGQQVITLGGAAPDIAPQRARTLSIGADVQVPFVQGLSLGLTYYKIKLAGLIQQPPTNDAATFWPNFANLVTFNPTPAQIAAATTGALLTGQAAPCNTAGCAYAIIDNRRRNIGDYLQDGFDIEVRYTRPTSFGSVHASFNGNYVLRARQSRFPGGPLVTDLIEGTNPHHRWTMRAGAQIGNFSIDASLRHIGGFEFTIPVGSLKLPPQQTESEPFDTVDFLFAYDVKGEGILTDTRLTLNITNAFNASPPFLASGPGFNSSVGSTIGRVIEFGIRKKF